jgi:nucleotide-binding universal stress UspA family protein
MSPIETRLQRIVLATDLKDQAAPLFAHCLAMALRARAVLYLVHIMDSDGPDSGWNRLPTVRSLLERWGRIGPDAEPEALEALGVRVHPLDFAPTDSDIRQALIRRVTALQPELLVLGTHSRQGFDRIMVPSVSEPIVRDLRRLTLFVPLESHGFVDQATGEVAIRRVMIPIAPGVPQQPMIVALTSMLDILGVDNCQFTLVHVGGEGTIPLPRLPERSGWTWKTDRRAGSVVDQLLQAEVEHSPDLVVMATEGPHGLLDSLLGSTTERVLRRIRSPLLAVPV